MKNVFHNSFHAPLKHFRISFSLSQFRKLHILHQINFQNENSVTFTRCCAPPTTVLVGEVVHHPAATHSTTPPFQYSANGVCDIMKNWSGGGSKCGVQEAIVLLKMAHRLNKGLHRPSPLYGPCAQHAIFDITKPALINSLEHHFKCSTI